jgi:hypothetical protein
LLWVVRSIEVLLLGTTWRIAAATAVSATLEALAAAAAAGHSAAKASYYTGYDTEEDQASNDNDCNNGPSGSGLAGIIDNIGIGLHVLAKVGGHTVVPAGNGSLKVVDLGSSVIDDISSFDTGRDTPRQAIADNLPHGSP